MEFALPNHGRIALEANDSYQTKRFGKVVMKRLIISDIHGNWVALQALLRAERHVDNILCRTARSFCGGQRTILKKP
jgi:hypothetical protein